MIAVEMEVMLMRLRMNRNLEPPLKVQGHDVVFVGVVIVIDGRNKQ